MVPKWDQRRRYASKAKIRLCYSLAVKQGGKSTAGQVMRQQGGQETWQITRWLWLWWVSHGIRLAEAGLHVCLKPASDPWKTFSETVAGAVKLHAQVLQTKIDL